MGLLTPGYGPHGVVAITTGLADSGLVGDTETVVYKLTFTAAPKRIYRINFRAMMADTDSTGDQTNTIIRYAKNGATIGCRWATGSTVTTSGTPLGYIRATVFDDDSVTAMGAELTCYLVNPPRGQLTVGITLKTARAAATYGQVQLYQSGVGHLAIEDVGPYSA